MKIELNDEASSTAIVLIVALTIIALAILIFRYNAIAYEQGYVQKQLENSQLTYWTKE